MQAEFPSTTKYNELNHHCTYKNILAHVWYVEYPKTEPTTDWRPDGTSRFCSKFILFPKFEVFSNVVYIVNLVNIFEDLASKLFKIRSSVLKTAVYFLLDPTAYDGNYTYSTMWIDSHLAFKPYSSVCECHYFKLLCFDN